MHQHPRRRPLSAFQVAVRRLRSTAWLDRLPPSAAGADVVLLRAATRLARIRGFDVVAVEPAPNMIAEAQRLHRGLRIQWLDDSLPSLARTVRLGGGFDLILLSAVWRARRLARPAARLPETRLDAAPGWPNGADAAPGARRA